MAVSYLRNAAASRPSAAAFFPSSISTLNHAYVPKIDGKCRFGQKQNAASTVSAAADTKTTCCIHHTASIVSAAAIKTTAAYIHVYYHTTTVSTATSATTCTTTNILMPRLRVHCSTSKPSKPRCRPSVEKVRTANLKRTTSCCRKNSQPKHPLSAKARSSRRPKCSMSK